MASARCEVSKGLFGCDDSSSMGLTSETDADPMQRGVSQDEKSDAQAIEQRISVSEAPAKSGAELSEEGSVARRKLDAQRRFGFGDCRFGRPARNLTRCEELLKRRA